MLGTALIVGLVILAASLISDRPPPAAVQPARQPQPTGTQTQTGDPSAGGVEFGSVVGAVSGVTGLGTGAVKLGSEIAGVGAAGGAATLAAAGFAAGAAAGSLAGAGAVGAAGTAATASLTASGASLAAAAGGTGVGTAGAVSGATAAAAGGEALAATGSTLGTSLVTGAWQAALLIGIYVAVVATVLTITQTALGFLRRNRQRTVLGSLSENPRRYMLEFEDAIVASCLDSNQIAYTSFGTQDPALDLVWKDPDSSATLVSKGYRFTYTPSGLPVAVWERIQFIARVASFHYADALSANADNILVGIDAANARKNVRPIDADAAAIWATPLAGGAVPGITYDQAAAAFAGQELSDAYNFGTAAAMMKAANTAMRTDTRVFISFDAPAEAARLYQFMHLSPAQGFGFEPSAGFILLNANVFGDCLRDAKGVRRFGILSFTTPDAGGTHFQALPTT